MPKVYYFDNPNSPIGNSVVVLSPRYNGDTAEAIIEAIKNQGLPIDTPYEEVIDALEPVFKVARKVEDGKLVADLDKSKIIAHIYRRFKRSLEFSIIDGDNMNVQVTPGAEAQRQTIRDKYNTIQNNLDAAVSVAALKVEMEKEGLI